MDDIELLASFRINAAFNLDRALVGVIFSGGLVAVPPFIDKSPLDAIAVRFVEEAPPALATVLHIRANSHGCFLLPVLEPEDPFGCPAEFFLVEIAR